MRPECPKRCPVSCLRFLKFQHQYCHDNRQYRIRKCTESFFAHFSAAPFFFTQTSWMSQPSLSSISTKTLLMMPSFLFISLLTYSTEEPSIVLFWINETIAPTTHNIMRKYSKTVPILSKKVIKAIRILNNRLIGNKSILMIHLNITQSSLSKSVFVSPHTISIQTFTSV